MAPNMSVDNLVRSIFLRFEQFFNKTVPMNIFEMLHFRYKFNENLFDQNSRPNHAIVLAINALVADLQESISKYNLDTQQLEINSTKTIEDHSGIDINILMQDCITQTSEDSRSSPMKSESENIKLLQELLDEIPCGVPSVSNVSEDNVENESMRDIESPSHNIIQNNIFTSENQHIIHFNSTSQMTNVHSNTNTMPQQVIPRTPSIVAFHNVSQNIEQSQCPQINNIIAVGNRTITNNMPFVQNLPQSCQIVSSVPIKNQIAVISMPPQIKDQEPTINTNISQVILNMPEIIQSESTSRYLQGSSIINNDASNIIIRIPELCTGNAAEEANGTELSNHQRGCVNSQNLSGTIPEVLDCNLMMPTTTKELPSTTDFSALDSNYMLVSKNVNNCTQNIKKSSHPRKKNSKQKRVVKQQPPRTKAIAPEFFSRNSKPQVIQDEPPSVIVNKLTANINNLAPKTPEIVAKLEAIRNIKEEQCKKLYLEQKKRKRPSASNLPFILPQGGLQVVFEGIPDEDQEKVISELIATKQIQEAILQKAPEIDSTKNKKRKKKVEKESLEPIYKLPKTKSTKRRKPKEIPLDDLIVDDQSMTLDSVVNLEISAIVNDVFDKITAPIDKEISKIKTSENTNDPSVFSNFNKKELAQSCSSHKDSEESKICDSSKSSNCVVSTPVELEVTEDKIDEELSKKLIPSCKTFPAANTVENEDLSCETAFSDTEKEEFIGPKQIKTRIRNNKPAEVSGCVWSCNICERSFTSSNRLNLHVTYAHQKSITIDDIGECALQSNLDTSSIEKEELLEDVKLDQASVSIFCCYECLTAFRNMKAFAEHDCKLTKEDNEEGHVPKVGMDRLIRSWDQLSSLRSICCGQCREVYMSLTRTIHHFKRCKPGPYKCELCNYTVSNMNEINYHKRLKHADSNPFFCPFCERRFKFRSSQQRHMVNRHENNQGPFKCTECKQQFPKKIHLTRHKSKEHVLEQNFLCQICGNRFHTQNSLGVHLAIHKKGNRFRCNICLKSFANKERLMYHNYIHTGERPFKCPFCGKGFTRKHKLMDHERRHSGVKPHECPDCFKTYAAIADLRKHIKKMHAPDPEPPDPDDYEAIEDPVEDPLKEESTAIKIDDTPVSSVKLKRKLAIVPTVPSVEETQLTLSHISTAHTMNTDEPPTVMGIDGLDLSTLGGNEMELPQQTQQEESEEEVPRVLVREEMKFKF